MSKILELPPNRLTISWPEEAWSTKIVLVAEKNKNSTLAKSHKSLTAGLCGNTVSVGESYI